jgi:hypothetical protein
VGLLTVLNELAPRLYATVIPNVLECVLRVIIVFALTRLAKPEWKVASRIINQGAPQERTQS